MDSNGSGSRDNVTPPLRARHLSCGRTRDLEFDDAQAGRAGAVKQLLLHLGGGEHHRGPPGTGEVRRVVAIAQVQDTPAPPGLIKVWEERYGADIVHVWGMTETTTVGTVARPPSGVSGEARWAYRISQGRVTPALEYRVVNDGKVMASNDLTQGEIQVRGNMVAASYYHSPTQEPDERASTFRGEEVDDVRKHFTADGWLRTRDVGTVTNAGFMTFYDRARDVIRSGGDWIYSAQVENLIMESDKVVEYAVIGIPDKKWGERPLAVTKLLPGIEPDAGTARQLRASLAGNLPAWMVPEYWAFVDSIDKTSVGKFDKKDLRKHLAAEEFDIIALPGPGARSEGNLTAEQVEALES